MVEVRCETSKQSSKWMMWGGLKGRRTLRSDVVFVNKDIKSVSDTYFASKLSQRRGVTMYQKVDQVRIPKSEVDISL